jgi:hypothetical protein
MGILRTVEQKIRLLSDSSSRNDTILFMQRLQDAKATNQSVTSTEEHVLNEKWVNKIYLRIIEFGHDTLSTEEMSQLHDMAHSCPAVNGLGVYHARYLNAFYEPLADYNDYVLCNTASRGGGNVFDAVNNFLHNAGNPEGPASAGFGQQQGITAYPVPAMQEVHFKSELSREKDGTIVLYDVFGKELQRKPWGKGLEQASMEVHQLSNGLYYYSVYIGQACFYGKLSVQH